MEYTITPAGLAFIPFIQELKKWGDTLLAKNGRTVMPPPSCDE